MSSGRRKQISVRTCIGKQEREITHADSGKHVLYFDGEEGLKFITFAWSS